MGIMHTLKQKFMKQRARAKIFRRTTLTNDYKSKCEFSIFRLNFTTIAGSERRRKRKMFTYGTARFSLHLITLICCYLFASVHVKFIQLNLSKFWSNMNCLFIPFSPFASPFLSLSRASSTWILNLLTCSNYSNKILHEMVWIFSAALQTGRSTLFIGMGKRSRHSRIAVRISNVLATFYHFFMSCSNYLSGWIIWTVK